MANGALLGIPLPSALTLPDVEAERTTEEQQRLKNQIYQATLPFLPAKLRTAIQLQKLQGEAIPTEIALKQAQIGAMPTTTALKAAQTLLAQQRAEQLAKGIPERYAPGAAGLIQGQKVIENEFGADSPEAKQAAVWNDTSNSLKASRSRYFDANLALKNMPLAQKEQLVLQMQKDTGKPIAQISHELSGNIPIEQPSTNTALSILSNTIDNPNSQASAIHNTYFPTDKEKQENNEQVTQTENLLAKQVGSTAAQKALPPLLDITKTINQIDFTPVAKFAGLHGKTYATIERAKAALGGNVSPDFEAYDNFVQSQGKLLADATRQALQTSVRSGYVKSMLMPLTNTSVWYENPELAMNRFNFFRNWLNDRTKMFQLLATKGISPNANELDKQLGIGKPTEQSIQSEASTLSTKDLLALRKKLITEGRTTE